MIAFSETNKSKCVRINPKTRIIWQHDRLRCIQRVILHLFSRRPPDFINLALALFPFTRRNFRQQCRRMVTQHSDVFMVPATARITQDIRDLHPDKQFSVGG
jgi:hypothetical protein